jgi:redox-sensitive bicupin YhaK (pirin superfamily)
VFDGATRFLEIEIEPDQRGAAPSCERSEGDVADVMNRLRLVASGKRPRLGAVAAIATAETVDAHDAAPSPTERVVELHADVDIFASVLSRGARVEHTLAVKRFAWIQVARGSVRMNGVLLATGDGAAVAELPAVALTGDADEAELLLFDLA